MTQEERNEILRHIEVEKAYLDGQAIEFRSRKAGEWITVISIPSSWDWLHCDYRVKPEPSKPKYRPFENAEEVMEAIKEHGMYLMSKETGTNKMLIVEFNDFYVWCGASPMVKYISYYFETNYTFADGTPFGKLIKNKR